MNYLQSGYFQPGDFVVLSEATLTGSSKSLWIVIGEERSTGGIWIEQARDRSYKICVPRYRLDKAQALDALSLL